MENKIIFPITKYKNDENISFSYLRSYITFYNFCFLINNKEKFEKIKIKEKFKFYYKNDKYFNFFYDTFFIKKNILIFTYYNNIPYIFYPYPDELYYYYPIITFYDNNNYFFKKGKVTFGTKILYKHYQYDLKYDKKEIQVTIPISFLANYIFPDKYFCLLYVDKHQIITDNIAIKNNNVTINNYYLKNNNSYKVIKKTYIFSVSKILYASVLLEINDSDLLNVYKTDIIKKGCLLYHNTVKFKLSKILQNKIIRFFTLYPKLNIYDLQNKTDCKWACIKAKLKKKLQVLNLTIDIFYNNEIIKNNIKNNYRYLDYRDPEYKIYKKDELFRCVNSTNKLKKRKNICNFNMISNLKKFSENKGKKSLNHIIFKNNFFADYYEKYYFNFLKKYNIDAFVYHPGYLIENKLYYDMELCFISDDILKKTIKYIDVSKNQCHDLYKKGLLKNI